MMAPFPTSSKIDCNNFFKNLLTTAELTSKEKNSGGTWRNGSAVRVCPVLSGNLRSVPPPHTHLHPCGEALNCLLLEMVMSRGSGLCLGGPGLYESSRHQGQTGQGMNRRPPIQSPNYHRQHPRDSICPLEGPKRRCIWETFRSLDLTHCQGRISDR